MTTPSSTPWPYPLWIAHRGAGKLAPENTLAAFREGARHGYRMFECDVKLSADDVPFLLHDDGLQRTTNAPAQWGEAASANAGQHPWSALALLDAGAWHSAAYAGEPLPSFAAIARYCVAQGFCLNVEIKPCPGSEHHTGAVVARHAALHWQGQAVPPLLSSFSVDALHGAQEAQPKLPRALLLDTLWDGWLEAARQLRCQAIVCNHRLWDVASVGQALGAGMRALSYTVNEEADARRLLQLGTHGIITDRVDRFSPATPFA